MDWKTVAGKVANAGLPILAKILDGAIDEIPVIGGIAGAFIDAETIERAARKAVAAALGVDMTPEAIANAIENKPTSEVIGSLQGAQSALANHFPALAEIFKSEDALDAEVVKANAETSRMLFAGDMARNDWAWSLYRGITLNGTAGMFLTLLLSLVVVILACTWAVAWGNSIPLTADAINALVALYGIGFSACGGIMGFHWKFRKDERVAAITPPAPSPAPALPAAVTKLAGKK